VIIGAGAVVLPKLTIGEGVSVGALSLVNKTLKPWGVYFGMPVKRLRERSREMLVLEHEYLNEQGLDF
jgi:galactoside O-acetyltransferase